MRVSFKGTCLSVLFMFSSQLAAATDTPSLSGTTIPSATQIIDTKLNAWTLSNGMAYENGRPTPSSGVILLLCYGGIVYQENSKHDWWLWNANTDTWVASIDPRVISPSGTTIPVATQIVDSVLAVWTLSGGQAYVHGTLTPSSGVIKLLYAKGIVFQENSKHLWFQWRDGAWEASAAPPSPSASGTTVPSATEIIDYGSDVWTLSGGKAYENHAVTPSSDVILLLFYGGIVYQENNAHLWWEWNGQKWKSTTADPRVGSPLAYVASTATGGKYSITVIDTGTNKVKATIPIPFEASYLTVTPDAKHVYVSGTSNTGYQSVAVIDTAQEKMLTSIHVQYDPQGIYTPQGIVVSPDGARVYVVYSDYDDQLSTVSTIETAANVVVAAINTQDYEFGITISPDGKTLYLPSGSFCGCAADMAGAWIDVIKTASNSLSTQFYIPVSFRSYDNGIFNIAISPNNSTLYANHFADSLAEIAILNPTNGDELKVIPDVLTVQVFSPDSLHLYGMGLGGVGVIDTTTEVLTTAVASIPEVSGLAITPDGNHLYITDATTQSVLVADTATHTISAVLPLPIDASGAIAIVAAH